MKKLFLIVAALFVAVSFSACSDDDDNGIDRNLIIGAWESVHYYAYEKDNGEEREIDQNLVRGDDNWERMEFFDDGIVELYTSQGISNIKCQYSIDGNILTQSYTYSDGTSDSDKHTITTLTDTSLVIEEVESYTNYYWKSIVTYKRINMGH